ncbi:hypothetical protein C8R41DRAFT_915996 [Lentinula lateritia]|uniref:Uncharacterized protein n=1 Tax=Lentinula lateritia TaxID=40482 RepID=A0ABQ8VR73_9AGAR|nr:hypothetical protein C8R41DRAFT_915996 [Lentinula lateritia]
MFLPRVTASARLVNCTVVICIASVSRALFISTIDIPRQAPKLWDSLDEAVKDVKSGDTLIADLDLQVFLTPYWGLWPGERMRLPVVWMSQIMQVLETQG